MADQQVPSTSEQAKPEPTKKKRHVVRNVLIVAVVAVIALVAVSFVGGSGSVAPSTEEFDPNDYQTVEYSALAKTPDDYKDQKLVFTGNVIQVQEGSTETDLRLATDASGYDDIILVRFDPSILDGNHIVENQTIAVYGRCTGQETYTSVLGQSVSIPGMIADHIDENAKSKQQEQIEKVQALFDGVTFEKHDEGYGSYTYSATVTNNTDTDYDDVSLTLGLYDANGTRLEETYASVNSWAAGESSVFSAYSTTDAAQVKAEVEYFSIDGQPYSAN